MPSCLCSGQLGMNIDSAKQVGCFNLTESGYPSCIATSWRDSVHERFTLVWLHEVTREVAAQFILKSDNPQNISGGVIINALQSCSKELPCLKQAGESPHRWSEGFQYVVVAR